jgi:dTMP kinase
LSKGFFIVLEGPDGSGKSTQAELLFEKLSDDGYSCVRTEEPGGTFEGEKIRDLLLNPDFNLCPKSELFLFLADRAEHVDRIIKPGLSEGKIVICSRYLYSTLVYQGFARQIMEIDFLKKINMFAVNNIEPDLVFFLDIIPEKGLSKARENSSLKYKFRNGDRIEMEGIEFQQRVREGYLQLASEYSSIFTIVKGGRSREEINNDIYILTKRRLQND